MNAVRGLRSLVDGRNGLPYLNLVAVAIPLGVLALSWDRQASALGPPLGFLLQVVLTFAAMLLWPLSPSGERRDPMGMGFVVLLLGAWAVAFALAVARSDRYGVTSLTVPLILGMVLVKPPDYRAARIAMDLFAVAMVAVTWLTFVAQSLSIGPSRWTGDCGYAFDQEVSCLDVGSSPAGFRLPLGAWLGLGVRSAGPFDHPNVLGQVMAILLVYGIARLHSRVAWFVAPSAAVFLLLSGSRSSLIGAVIGLGMIAVLPKQLPGIAISRRVRLLVAGGVAVAMVGFWVALNPGLTGRTSMWPQMLEVWRSSPLTGVGQEGILDAIEAGALPPWAVNGHNVVIDSLARTGVVGTVFVVLATVVALIVTVRAASTGMVASVGVVVTIVAAGMGDRTMDWMSPTARSVPFLLAVLLASAWNSGQSESRASGASGRVSGAGATPPG